MFSVVIYMMSYTEHQTVSGFFKLPIAEPKRGHLEEAARISNRHEYWVDIIGLRRRYQRGSRDGDGECSEEMAAVNGDAGVTTGGFGGR